MNTLAAGELSQVEGSRMRLSPGGWGIRHIGGALPLSDNAAHVKVRRDQADVSMAGKHPHGRGRDPLRHEPRLRDRRHQMVFLSGKKQGWTLDLAQPLSHVVSFEDSEPVPVSHPRGARRQFQELLEFVPMRMPRVHEK